MFEKDRMFVIFFSEKLAELKRTLSIQIFSKFLSQINLFNTYLKSATLILSEIIQDSVNN